MFDGVASDETLPTFTDDVGVATSVKWLVRARKRQVNPRERETYQ